MRWNRLKIPGIGGKNTHSKVQWPVRPREVSGLLKPPPWMLRSLGQRLVRCRELQAPGQSFALSCVSHKRVSLWSLNIPVETPTRWDTCWRSTLSPGKDLENTHVSAPAAQGTQLLMTLWVSTPTPPPGEPQTPKGMPWELLTGFPVLLGQLPAPGS